MKPNYLTTPFTKPITEDKIEAFIIETLQSMVWIYLPGMAIAPGAEEAERVSFEQVVLVERLSKAVAVLNHAGSQPPKLPC